MTKTKHSAIRHWRRDTIENLVIGDKIFAYENNISIQGVVTNIERYTTKAKITLYSHVTFQCTWDKKIFILH